MKLKLPQLNVSVGLLALGAGLVALAVALPWMSLTLGRRAREASVRLVDLKAFVIKRPAANPEELQLLLAVSEQDQKRSELLQRMDLLQRFEWNMYDWRLGRRLRAADARSEVTLVTSDDSTITALGYGDAIPGERYNYIWPRMPVYGRALRELRAQGAAAVGFDVTFQDLLLEEGRKEYDAQFAEELRKPGAPSIIAIAPQQEPDPLFQYRAASVGDVATTKDADSVSRQVRAYTDFLQDNPRLGDLAEKNGWILTLTNRAWVRLQLNSKDPGTEIKVDDQGRVPLRKNRFATEMVSLQITNRVWHLGVVLAAYRLKVDLSQSGVEGGMLLLKATNGTVVRRFPVDEHRYFPVNWNWRVDGVREAAGSSNRIEKLESFIRQDWARTNSAVAVTNQPLKDRLVIIGSTASANNLADRGATPLGGSDFLVGTHLNVANQILSDEFIITPHFRWVALLMIGFAVTACCVTWSLRGAWPLLVISGMGVGWFMIAVWAFDSQRLVLPIVHPLVAGLMIPYGAMVSARAIFEQRERHRVRSVFAKMVSPDIVQEMLGSGRIELGGSRRELSVLFADIRGFTALTDRYQAEAEHYVAEHNLTGAAAEAYYDARAHEVLETVNLYLGAIADVVKFHLGTLDKYIGDCVMAFWGAPVTNPRHSVNCVIAAIDAQRIIARLNANRSRENDRRTAENQAHPELKLEILPLVSLGTGVNSGVVTVGLMGSDAHIVNYTVFGREVNLASRLEGVSGYARIVIGEATFKGLQLHAPALAEICRPLDPVPVKGFRAPVKVYEVPWLEAEAAASQSLPLYQVTPWAGFTPVPAKA